MEPAGAGSQTDQRAGRAGSGGQAASGSCMHVSETSKVTLRAVLALVVFYCIVLVIFLPFKHNWAGDDESTGWTQLVSAMYFGAPGRVHRRTDVGAWNARSA